MTEISDIQRRMGNLETRLDWLDQHGTRGVDGVRTQLATINRDIGKMERTIEAMQSTLAQLKPQRTWPQVFAYLGLLIPMYALVIALLAGK